MQGNGDETRGRGARGWLLPFMEERASRLMARDATAGPDDVPEIEGFVSAIQPLRRGAQALAPLPPTYWLDALQEFHRRRALSRTSQRRFAPGEPTVPGTTNWVPIGPSVARKGQAGGHPGVSGRVARIAVAPGGTRVYVATALGGVWRSDDGGATWNTNEDSLDVDPTSFGSTSLSCGAIAINENMPDRVYVGSGEGDTSDIFNQRFLGYLPSYRGIGPVRSDDGGASWHVEPVATGSPPLAGQSFYELAVDPGDGDRVVAATTAGLYRRQPHGGGYHWVQKRTGVHSDVVVASTGGTTTFFAAAWGGPVYSSPDGHTWTVAGTGFPAGATRISLAVRPTDPGAVYALAADTSFNLLGIFRLDGGAGAWKAVTGAPDFLAGQGDYTCAITVDPNDPNTIYVGAGSTFFNGDWSGTVYRGAVSPAAGAYSVATTYIGGDVHGDIHDLINAPGDSSTLWLGSDGGVFVSGDTTGAADFGQRNVGLATLAMNYFSQHPTQDAVVFCGAQDNGTIRYTGEEAWRLVVEADGGYCVVNWHDPYQVIIFQNGSLQRTTDGGATFGYVTPPGYFWSSGIMAPPFVGAPISATPADANVAALGADRPYLTADFGSTWASIPNNDNTDVLPAEIYSMTFASASKLYAGTTDGEVYRYDLAGGAWTRTRIDNAPGGPLALANIVTGIAVDPADATGNSVYIAFGGSGDFRHVWHFDGNAWSQRSGPAAGAMTALLDVEHNAIAADPIIPGTIFAGADIGVWRSVDGGMNWSVFSDGLPDAAVLDLLLHPASRLLRAATHGRGLFEFKLDPPAALDTELYVRDTDLDTGRVPTVDWLPDPEQDGALCVHWESPNIKVDVPTPAGYQTPTTSINFFQFVDVIQDGGGGVATIDPASGTVVNRVYVEVHNRGVVPATTVQVMLLLVDASPSLPPLPAGYVANVQAGTPVGAPFTLVGVKTLANVRAGIPQVVEFPLPSTMLPPPASLPGDAHYCLLALLHSPQDVFAGGPVSVDALTIADRKVAQKNLNIVAFVGVPPPPAPVRWAAFQLTQDQERGVLSDLILEAADYPGRIGLVLPHGLTYRDGLEKSLTGFSIEKGEKYRDQVEDWRERQHRELRALIEDGRYNRAKCEAMIQALKRLPGQPLLLAEPGAVAQVRGFELAERRSVTAFLAIQPPAKAAIGDRFDFRLLVRKQGHAPTGGCTYSVRILAPFER